MALVKKIVLGMVNLGGRRRIDRSIEIDKSYRLMHIHIDT